MAFTLKIGSHSRPAGEVGITKIDKETIRSDRGLRRFERQTWDLNGQIQVDSASEMDSAMLEFESNLRSQLLSGGDLRFVNADGNTTAHIIRASQTMNGVNLVNLQWQSSDGAEHSVYRSYSLQVEAMFRLGGINDLISFRESITFIGGGPRHVWTELNRGSPQRQRVNDQTTYKAVQSGNAVGDIRTPIPPGPLWPNVEHRDRRIEEPSSPEIINGAPTNYGIRWQYEFESGSPLIGQPNVR